MPRRQPTPQAPKASPEPPSLKEQLQAAAATLDEARRAAHTASESERKAQREVENLQAQIQQGRAEALHALIEKEPGLLDVLAPAHSRTSCNDDSFDNANRGCSRCALLTMRDYRDLDIDFEFVVKSRP